MPRLLAIALLLSAACNSRESVHQRFVDMSVVDDAGMGRFEGVVTGARAPFEVRDASIHGDRRPSVVVDAPATLTFRADSGDAPRLRFGLGVRPPESEVTVRSIVNGSALHERRWEGQLDWVDESISLDGFANASIELELHIEGEGTVMLSHPEIVGRTEAPARPNVIVYVIDCLRADHVGAYGYELPTTPALDALAADSVVFEDLTACAPWTKPSTACLLTSLQPIYHQARTVDDALAHDRHTVAEVFRAAGYTTAAWVANPVIDPRVFFFNQGFDRWVDLRSFEERTTRTHQNALDPDAADITERVVPWLTAHQDETFFLYLHSLDLHYEYRPRPPFDETFVTAESSGLERDRELYDNELAYNDHEVGKLVAHLKALGLYDDTVLFVTADHGEEFGEHGATRHGTTLYQEALHIPGILKFPDSRFAGQRSPMLMSNIDIAPTLLDVAGIEVPDTFQGSREIVDALIRAVRELHTGRAFAELVAPNHVSYAVRSERYKYVRNLAPALSEALYDLDAAPRERDSLLDQPPEKARTLPGELDRFVQLAQHGLHLSLRGTHPGKRSVVRVRSLSDATIANAFRFGMVTGDELELDPGAGSLEFEFIADDKVRHLVVQTRPEGAPMTLELRVDGEIVSSETVEPAKLEVSIAEAETLMHAEEEGAVRAWYLPFTAGRNRVELDEETTRNLKALGYLP